MIERRAFDTLGGANHGWLNAKHHFSFAHYHDPKRMNWGGLRVWNDDTIQPGTGFPPHPHADMEIITYVREGAITHHDNLNNQGRTVAGDVQVMSAFSKATRVRFRFALMLAYWAPRSKRVMRSNINSLTQIDMAT